METDLEFIREVFADQRDKTLRLSSEHAEDVGYRLLQILALEDWLTDGNITLLWRAAIGHDLLEDTSITRSQLVEHWDETTVELIETLTNRKGDQDFAEYLQALSQAPEETVLIKLCDIESNIQNSLTKHHLAGEGWLETFWLPLLEKYLTIFQNYQFTRFPKAGKTILAEIEQGIVALRQL